MKPNLLLSIFSALFCFSTSASLCASGTLFCSGTYSSLDYIFSDPPVVNDATLAECENNNTPGNADFIISNANDAIYMGGGQG